MPCVIDTTTDFKEDNTFPQNLELKSICLFSALNIPPLSFSLRAFTAASKAFSGAQLGELGSLP